MAGETFYHWDRWMLSVIVIDHDGDCEELTTYFRSRRGRFYYGYELDDVEAKICQLDDLRRRLERIDLTPAEVLGEDAVDRTLNRKARTKIFDQFTGSSDATEVMRNTPRNVLRERSYRGQWPQFPVSPSRYEAIFTAEIEKQDHYPMRDTVPLRLKLGELLEHEARNVDGDPAHQLALHRAFLASGILAMHRIDDSFGEIGGLYQNKLSDYFAVPWKETGIAVEVYYRDFLEFALWEEFAITWQRLGPFFNAVDAGHVDLVESLLRELHEELLGHELDSQAEEALSLIVELLVSRECTDRFVDLAAEMGSREWQRVESLAKGALEVGQPDLVQAIFAASDQPGPHRDYLRKRCRELLGTTPAPRRPHLTLVR